MKICVIIMKKWYDNQRNYYSKIMIIKQLHILIVRKDST